MESALFYLGVRRIVGFATGTGFWGAGPPVSASVPIRSIADSLAILSIVLGSIMDGK